MKTHLVASWSALALCLAVGCSQPVKDGATSRQTPSMTGRADMDEPAPKAQPSTAQEPSTPPSAVVSERLDDVPKAELPPSETTEVAPQTEIQPAPTDPQVAKADESVQPQPVDPNAEVIQEEVALLKTNYGELVVEFWPEVAPNTVENFKKLAREGFYNGTAFHRVIKGFMIQGGDPYTKDPADEPLWGTGDPGYTVEAEVSDRPHERGVISMARGQDPNSAGSQFFICLGPVTSLDGKFTAFGRLFRGDEVLEKIGNVDVRPNAQGEVSRPVSRVHLESVRIMPKTSIP
jgi:peptidyl-prolyl cis-trans isomerase B (cyclophilin B)